MSFGQELPENEGLNHRNQETPREDRTEAVDGGRGMNQTHLLPTPAGPTEAVALPVPGVGSQGPMGGGRAHEGARLFGAEISTQQAVGRGSESMRSPRLVG